MKVSNCCVQILMWFQAMLWGRAPSLMSAHKTCVTHLDRHGSSWSHEINTTDLNSTDSGRVKVHWCNTKSVTESSLIYGPGSLMVHFKSHLFNERRGLTTQIYDEDIWTQSLHLSATNHCCLRVPTGHHKVGPTMAFPLGLNTGLQWL